MDAKVRLTHVALIVRDVERSVRFYSDVVGLAVVHRRGGEPGRDAVAWMADADVASPDFALVLIQPSSSAAPQPRALLTGWSHVGISLGSREAVDEHARRGRDAGCLRMEPTYVDAVVGYICIVADPDGNGVEFSHGQVLGRPVLSETP